MAKTKLLLAGLLCAGIASEAAAQSIVRLCEPTSAFCAADIYGVATIAKQPDGTDWCTEGCLDPGGPLPPARIDCDSATQMAVCVVHPRGPSLSYEWADVGPGATLSVGVGTPGKAKVTCKKNFTGTVTISVKVSSSVTPATASAETTLQCQAMISGPM